MVHTSSREVLQHLPTYPPNRFDWHDELLLEFLVCSKLAGLGTACPTLPLVRDEGSLPLRKGGKDRTCSSLPEFFVTAQWGLWELVSESSEITLAVRGGRVCLDAQGEEKGDWKMNHTKEICNLNWILSRFLQWYFNYWITWEQSSLGKMSASAFKKMLHIWRQVEKKYQQLIQKDFWTDCFSFTQTRITRSGPGKKSQNLCFASFKSSTFFSSSSLSILVLSHFFVLFYFIFLPLQMIIISPLPKLGRTVYHPDLTDYLVIFQCGWGELVNLNTILILNFYILLVASVLFCFPACIKVAAGALFRGTMWKWEMFINGFL